MVLFLAGCGLLGIGFSGVATAANWPGWRGVSGNGIAGEENIPLKWSQIENVRWRIPLPDRGNSTPIAWADRLFLTQTVEKENRRTLMCINRSNGALFWQSGITYTEDEPTHRWNPYCAASPVTDGERVIAFFGSAGLYCYDFAGKELWHRDLGKIVHSGGSGASPILYGNLCILNFGPGPNSALTALNKQSGEIAWRYIAPNAQAGHSPGEVGAASGPGRMGPGRMLGWAFLNGADVNQDEIITEEEFSALALRWFQASDSAKSGSVNEAQLVQGLNRTLGPLPAYARQDGPRPAPGPALAPVLFRAMDTDQDELASRDEFTKAFAQWFQEWDSNHDGTVTPDELRPGLRILMAPPGERERITMPEGPAASWGTPIILSADGHDELIMAFPGRLAAFDPMTGKELWSVKGLGAHIKASPVWGEGVVVAMGGGPVAGALAVRPGGKGDVEETHRVWERARVRNRIGSGVIHRGYFYTVSEVGIAECLDLRTGRTTWEERLQGARTRGATWSSLVLARDRLYIPTQSGEVFVLRASPKFEILSVNSVESETLNASLAVSDGEIFIRTFKHLWCIGDKAR